ncbi:MAG: winged helix-turn-helix domain-containing protein [Beijerinckiaceae bacterium]|jgi:molybdate transport system regulatory protein|nr:winged helix-turn-helix domain-containing protein [Beijerinckiaceae bacterium]
MTAARITIRLDFGKTSDGKNIQLGHGKIRLLEMIEEHGSISSAARAMKMSYRRAWLLMDEVNSMFDTPLLETRPGGKGGGHARLTDFGQGVVALYRRIENDAEGRFAAEIDKLKKRLGG